MSQEFLEQLRETINELADERQFSINRNKEQIRTIHALAHAKEDLEKEIVDLKRQIETLKAENQTLSQLRR
ncbi:MAG: hypothetical protein DRJ03_01270 [Chloroflexi bacterium]|nr:MAG: hypothetical protein DRJ03_01270 [Chloroflexota bacterium]